MPVQFFRSGWNVDPQSIEGRLLKREKNANLFKEADGKNSWRNLIFLRKHSRNCDRPHLESSCTSLPSMVLYLQCRLQTLDLNSMLGRLSGSLQRQFRLRHQVIVHQLQSFESLLIVPKADELKANLLLWQFQSY
jgi:hypothetical protein